MSSGSTNHSHTPTSSTCPTPARRRHRTTFTQVKNYAYISKLIKTCFILVHIDLDQSKCILIFLLSRNFLIVV